MVSHQNGIARVRKEKKPEFKQKERTPPTCFLPTHYRLEAPPIAKVQEMLPKNGDKKSQKQKEKLAITISLSDSSYFDYEPSSKFPIFSEGMLPCFITETLADNFEQFELRKSYTIVFGLKNYYAAFETIGNSYLRFPSAEKGKADPPFTKPLLAFISKQVAFYLQNAGVKTTSDLMSPSQKKEQRPSRIISETQKVLDAAESRFKRIVKRIQAHAAEEEAKKNGKNAPSGKCPAVKANSDVLTNTTNAALDITEALKEDMHPTVRAKLSNALQKLIKSMHGLSM
ncbi:MAG: hypothetical protein WCT52_02920 [Candidatus Micrarchaeia archaeon]